MALRARVSLAVFCVAVFAFALRAADNAVPGSLRDIRDGLASGDLFILPLLGDPTVVSKARFQEIVTQAVYFGSLREDQVETFVRGAHAYSRQVARMLDEELAAQAAPPASPPRPRPTPETSWDTFGFFSADQIGTVQAFICPPLQNQRVVEEVYGTDRYGALSGLCMAAVHAGVITKSGGRIVVAVEPPLASYAASVRNGIESSTWKRGGPSSFRFVREERP